MTPPSPFAPHAPDRYAVLGHPVAHSQSPFIHAAFAQQTGQAIDYGRFECPLDDFAGGVARFIALANPVQGIGPARGCNITLPFKFQVLPLARQATPRAQLAQAANTLRFDGDGWSADNTDGIGLMRDIQGSAGQSIAGLKVLLIGAGGAAAGVLGPLLDAGPAAVTVANRTRDKAESLVQRHAALAAQRQVGLVARGLADAGAGYDLVINSSASSLAGGGVPVGPEVLAPGALAVDLMYGAPARPFLDWATAHGARPRDGLGMLVEQAAESFRFWRGMLPETAPVLAALRARLAGRG